MAGAVRFVCGFLKEVKIFLWKMYAESHKCNVQNIIGVSVCTDFFFLSCPSFSVTAFLSFVLLPPIKTLPSFYLLEG